jgi:hypothetical protein
MVVFQTKNANFDIFWKALVWIFLGELHVHSEFLLLFWYILWQSCTYVCGHFGHFPQFFFFFCTKKNLATLLAMLRERLLRRYATMSKTELPTSKLSNIPH